MWKHFCFHQIRSSLFYVVKAVLDSYIKTIRPSLSPFLNKVFSVIESKLAFIRKKRSLIKGQY